MTIPWRALDAPALLVLLRYHPDQLLHVPFHVRSERYELRFPLAPVDDHGERGHLPRVVVVDGEGEDPLLPQRVHRALDPLVADARRDEIYARAHEQVQALGGEERLVEQEQLDSHASFLSLLHQLLDDIDLDV